MRLPIAWKARFTQPYRGSYVIVAIAQTKSIYNLICIRALSWARLHAGSRTSFAKGAQGFCMITDNVSLAVPYTQEPYATLNLRVAEAIKEQILRQPNSVLGLPTGRTPTGVYKLLSDWTKQGELDWSKVRCFGLDEYYEVQETETFRYYLETNLYRNINCPDDQRFNPAYIDDYDRLIADNGGLDLAILGIGTNGHIAFNEPGTPANSWTHCVYLTESTRKANAEFFKNVIPKRAITMGIQTIMEAKRIILMASGKQKKEI
jgi:glucosamine-6-phosphate deaminase